MLGFIRGLLSHYKYNWLTLGDKTASIPETIQFIKDILKEDFSNLQKEVDVSHRDKTNFIKTANIFNHKSTVTTGITRTNWRSNLQIPPQYYIERGFNPEILNKYDVGLCTTHYDRIYVPIYDNNYKFVIGNTSRSVYNKCLICNSYHNPEQKCPRPEEGNYPKWKHSKGLNTGENLYNYWFAAPHIRDKKVVILTESPGNIWKLEEAGIHVGLAIFGSNFHEVQRCLLNRTGAMTVIIAMDNDSAGLRCMQQVDQMCTPIYKIYKFIPPRNDIGDMTVTEIQSLILPLYLNCIKEYQT
jgi:hypothetical protein